MSIREYFALITIVLQEPIFNGRVEMLKKELSKQGYTYDTGIKTAQYYFQEMKRAVKDGKENTFFQRFHTLIIKEDYYYFCEDGLGFGAQIKLLPSSFERFGEVLSDAMKAEKMDEPHPTDQSKDEKQKTEIGNPLIFSETLLKNVHREFNGIMWKSVDIDTLYNWFRKNPTGKIELKDGYTQTGLCYLIGRIDKIEKRIEVPNFEKWMPHHIGGNKYHRLKNIWENNSTESVERAKIDDLIKTL
jgi:hypothetical protein